MRPGVWYNVRMNTTSRNGIGISLSSNLYSRHDEVMSLLSNGWVQVTFRKGNGEVVTRLGTRNPTLVGTFGDRVNLSAIRNSDGPFNAVPLVYFDHAAGDIRSFYVEDVRSVCIPAECPENNH